MNNVSRIDELRSAYEHFSDSSRFLEGTDDAGDICRRSLTMGCYLV